MTRIDAEKSQSGEHDSNEPFALQPVKILTALNSKIALKLQDWKKMIDGAAVVHAGAGFYILLN